MLSDEAIAKMRQEKISKFPEGLAIFRGQLFDIESAAWGDDPFYCMMQLSHHRAAEIGAMLDRWAEERI